MSTRTIFGVVLAVLLFEIVIRNLQWGTPELDSRVGWTWRSTTVIHRLNEGFGVSHWLGDESRRSPTSGRGPRVLVLGDSFTEALQVNDDEVYSALLTNVDAINTGRSSHAAADYVAFAPLYLDRYDPRWTIIEVGSPDLSGDTFNTAKNHFDGLMNVVLVPPRFGEWSRRLGLVRSMSAEIDYGFARWSMYRDSSHMPPLFRAADADLPSKALPRVLMGRWPVDQEVSRLLTKYDGRVTFLFIPSWNSSPDDIETSLVDICRARKLSCVNLRDTFGGFLENGDAPFGFPNSEFGQGHLNRRGHASAARLLRGEIERLRARGLF